MKSCSDEKCQWMKSILNESVFCRLGGLGLRFARRVAPGAYWSSWADALAMIHQILPRVADSLTDRLEGAVAVGGCLGENLMKWATAWTDRGLSDVLVGLHDHLQHTQLSQVNGPTAGNTHLPLLNTTSGRRWCCPSGNLPTRPTCVLTPEEAPPMCSMDAPQAQRRQLCIAL